MSKKLPTESYRGVRDFYPEEQAIQNYILQTWRDVAERYGYVEYGASILEPAELYRAKGVENEEVVREQTYTFLDRGGREVTLRPEMTPTVARMVAARRRELPFPLRWYSTPNCFRYERTQRGRLREFWQLNVDLFGSRSIAADAEVILIAYALMRAFGAAERDFVIKLGSRAHIDEMIRARGLSEEGGKKLLALLDRKGKIPQSEFEAQLAALGVQKSALAGQQPPSDVAELIERLAASGIVNVDYDPSVVRGFAYYTGVVFEVFDTNPKNNRSLFGGGRYDNLTQLFDDEPLPCVGFGMGDVTVADFLRVRGLLPEYAPPTRVYLAVPAPELAREAQALAEELQREGVSVAVDFGEKKLGRQIETAAKLKIPYLVVVGPEELRTGTFAARDLASGQEVQMGRTELASYLLGR